MTGIGDKIDWHSRLAVNPKLVLRVEADDYALLFDPDSGRVQVFNETAVDIWLRLDGRKTLGEIIEDLGSCYEGMPRDAAFQIFAMVRGLVADGALQWREPD